jgi:hypothetical protein
MSAARKNVSIQIRVFLLALSALLCLASGPSAYDVTWTTPTPFDGRFYVDGMPAGNGNTVVLAWGDPSSGGLTFYVRSPNAMHTDATLFTLARISVSLSPNPFSNVSTGGYWNQTHHLQDGSISVAGGGGGTWASAAAVLTLVVDANAQVRAVTSLGCLPVFFDLGALDLCVCPSHRSCW